MRSVFTNLFSSIFGSRKAAEVNSTLSGTKLPEWFKRDVRFLLPETAEEYQQRLEALEQERLALAAELEKLDEEVEELCTRPGSEAERELNRRQAIRIGYGRMRLSDSVTGYPYSEIVKKLIKIPDDLRKEENWKIVAEGETVISSEKIRDRKDFDLRLRDRIERRVIRLQGRFFLVELCYPAVYRETGKTVCVGFQQTSHHSGEPVHGPERIPTEEFEQQPVIRWVTDSVAQMTNEELRAIGTRG